MSEEKTGQTEEAAETSSTSSGVWGSIVGQKKVIAQLQHEIAHPDQLAQSWLIAGPPGSGRVNVALAFAAALECPNGGDGTCKSCRNVLARTHPDVTVLSTSGVTITIDQVRQLVENSEQMPALGPWRIIIIEDVDRMTERTTNVLLKEVEEPADRTIWILCAPGAQDVLPTIRSRCRLVTLAVPSNEEVAHFLMSRFGPNSDFAQTRVSEHNKQEQTRGPKERMRGKKTAGNGLPITPEIARQDARIAQGHIGLATMYALNRQMVRDRGVTVRGVLSLRRSSDAVVLAGKIVDSARSQAQTEVQERTEKRSQQFLAENGLKSTRDIPPALRGAYNDAVGKVADQRRETTRVERDVYDRVLNDIASVYRDVCVLQAGAMDSAGIVNVENRTAVHNLAVQLSSRQAIDRLQAVEKTRRRIQGNGSAQLDFEALLCALVPPFDPLRK